MINYYEINDGQTVSANNTQAYKEFIMARAIGLGLYIFEGDPTTNGCTFDFGDFTYTPSQSSSYDSFMLTIVHPNNPDLCIVIGYLGTLKLNGFTGGSSYTYLAIYSHGPDGSLIYSRISSSTTTLGYKSYMWCADTSSTALMIFSGYTSLVVSNTMCGIISGNTTSAVPYFYTNKLVPIQFANIVPTDPHVIVINKPVAEYGVALVAFPTTDPIIKNRMFQFLLQGKTFYVINPVSRSLNSKFYCIY